MCAHLRFLWYLIWSALAAKPIKKHKVFCTIQTTVLLTMLCSLVLNLTALYIGLCVRKLEFSIFLFLCGVCKRFVNIVSYNLLFSNLLMSFCNEDPHLAFQIATSTLILLPPALFVYELGILKPRLVFMLYILLSMRMIIRSLERNNQECGLYKKRAFKVCVIILQYAVFYSIKSTLFIYF